MYSFLRGVVANANPTEVELDVCSVGYRLLIPLSTYSTLPRDNGEVKLLTYLYVRDNVMELYGFATPEERTTFELLLGISGVGPRVAQAILSTLSVAEVHRAVLDSDVAAFTKVRGIGKRTSQRIILELKNKLGAEDDEDLDVLLGEETAVSSSDVVDALVALGCAMKEARRAAQKAETSLPEHASVEEKIKYALRHI